MKKKYSIMAKGSKKAEVLLYDDIGEGWIGGISAKAFAGELAALGALDEINVRINSNGGSVFEGVAIYNTLIKNNARIVVDIDGIAASIASIIAMAGDEIRMAENAFLMIHDPWVLTGGTADDLRNTAETMDKVRDTLLETYSRRTTAEKEKISSWMKEETWFTAQEAMAAGLITSVSQEMKMAAFSGHDLSKYRNPPESLVATVKKAAGCYEKPRIESLKQRLAHNKNVITRA